MIDRLRQAMSAAGYDLGATELLDVLWLARVMEGRTAAGGPGHSGEPGERVGGTGDGAASGGEDAFGDGDGAQDGAGAGEGRQRTEAGGVEGATAAADQAPEGRSADAAPTTPVDPADPADSPASSGEPQPTESTRPLTPPGPPRRALYAWGSAGGEPGADRARPARVPGGRALPDAQQLGRALRPLRRSRDHPHRTVTDVEATVRLAAETGFLDVVSRPEQEPRWSAVLLVDCSAAMQVWGPLAAELRALLARSTVFRSVRIQRIDPRNPAGPVHRRRSAGASVTFLLTDGTSPGWRSPQTVRALTAWGNRGPLAVLNPLPRRLWRGTALDARPRLLAAPAEFGGLGRLLVCDPLSGERDPEAEGVLALPVLHPTASALEQWAGLLTRPGVPHLIDTVLLDELPGHRGPDRPEGSAEELLAHFRGAFSPEAYRLAVRLSAVRPLTTPLMQLVRAATMGDAGPTHVAEILLGGLLERTDRARDTSAAHTLDRALGAPPPGLATEPVYDFRPGVRELLFSGLGAEAAVEVVEAVGRSLEPYMGRLPDFPVLMGDEDGELRLQASARAFAVLASPVLERLGGAVPGPPGGVVPSQRRPEPAPPSLDERLSVPARRAVRLLALADLADTSPAGIPFGAAAALLDENAPRTREVLDELAAAGALRKTAADRHRLADEVRGPAREATGRELPAAQRDAALSRLLAWYLAVGRQMYALRYPGERMLQDLARVSSPGPLPTTKDRTKALADWVEELPQLLALVRRAVVRSPGTVRTAADLLLLAGTTADCGALSAAFEPAARTVAARAAGAGDARAEGRARLALAEAYLALGKADEAEAAARRAQELAGRCGDALTRFRAPYARGIIALHQGQHDTAERYLTPAWEQCGRRGDALGEALVLGALARLWAATGNGYEAVLFAERSIGAHRSAGGGSPRLAHGHYALAVALASAGRPAGALRELSRALPLFEEDRQRLWAGRTRCRMAEAMVALVRPGEAVTAAADAAERLLVPGGERWRADALTAAGHAQTALGHKQGARAHWREALAVLEEFGAPQAVELRALLREKPAPSPAGPHRPGLSRAAKTARTGTALRDLTAVVRTLGDQLRLRGADEATGPRPAGPTAPPDTPDSPDTSDTSDTPDAPDTSDALDALAAELAGHVRDLERTGRAPRAGLPRLRAALETLTASDALTAAEAGAAEAVAAVRTLSRRLT
ncbi:SAV_2336 N-terminal domain-related protein [Streptomyces sioyaensis]|uniref:SAV_2336 N-terminal domain-related protein n=1 Tax=Streptomyces sioyaensis TaxID=67364 RepID=UPI003650686B